MGIARGAGKAWDGVNGGAYRIVETTDDFVIVVTVWSERQVPTMPPSYNGVPVHFQVEE